MRDIDEVPLQFFQTYPSGDANDSYEEQYDGKG
jgi:hypothetical protein